MRKLKRRMVRTWLDQADAERLQDIAKRRGIDVPQLIEDALRPHIDAADGDTVFAVALDAADVGRLRRQVERLCEDEPDPVDIDGELSKHVDSFVMIGIDEG